MGGNSARDLVCLQRGRFEWQNEEEEEEGGEIISAMQNAARERALSLIPRHAKGCVCGERKS